MFHPDLVPWNLREEKCSEWNACWIIGNQEIINGELGYSSREILAGGPFGDEVIDEIRDLFHGEIVPAC